MTVVDWLSMGGAWARVVLGMATVHATQVNALDIQAASLRVGAFI